MGNGDKKGDGVREQNREWNIIKKKYSVLFPSEIISVSTATIHHVRASHHPHFSDKYRRVQRSPRLSSPAVSYSSHMFVLYPSLFLPLSPYHPPSFPPVSLRCPSTLTHPCSSCSSSDVQCPCYFSCNLAPVDIP